MVNGLDFFQNMILINDFIYEFLYVYFKSYVSHFRSSLLFIQITSRA